MPVNPKHKRIIAQELLIILGIVLFSFCFYTWILGSVKFDEPWIFKGFVTSAATLYLQYFIIRLVIQFIKIAREKKGR